ncbi:MAG: hypothetical protein DCC65_18125 [Planctomycetota bacterium]|nr:MAG: hypothetical protein DCC65_18125 [Planctomycetota bacterium]
MTPRIELDTAGRLEWIPQHVEEPLWRNCSGSDRREPISSPLTILRNVKVGYARLGQSGAV